MTNPTGQFPNETYLNGLRDNPDSTLAVVYDEFRQAVIRELNAIGGSVADGAVFFQTAVNDAARLAREGKLPAHIPVFELFKNLSRAHYLDWLDQRGQGDRTVPDAQGPSPFLESYIPDSASLRETRRKIYAWKQLQTLDQSCRELLLGSEAEPEVEDAEIPVTETHRHCTEQYLDRLKSAGLADDPGWPMAALRDHQGYAVWLRSQELEREWLFGKPSHQEPNRTWRWVAAALVIAAVSFGIYQYYYRPKTAAEVFAKNFTPPASLMDDLGNRYGPEMGNDSVSARPIECIRLLRQADRAYKVQDYEAALDPLLLIVLDSTSICQSDAWFFLGVIQLQLEDPETAIQCFAKIEDLSRYGEDLYWYQALAFVQLAKQNPQLRDKARRAVERTLGNTRDSLRRVQAETMLKNLSR